MLSICFLIYAIAIFKTHKIDAQAYYYKMEFIDFYQFAKDQRLARGLDILSLYLITLYALKFLQLIDSVSVIMIAFQNAYFEYFLLSFVILVIFISISVVMSFVFGSYMFEYNNFADAILTNLKIFIFSESTFVTKKLWLYFKNFSVIILILFIFIIKYFLLMLYYPIFIEYYRMECDRISHVNKEADEYEEDQKRFNEFGIVQSKILV